jgi:hypothetical protein
LDKKKEKQKSKNKNNVNTMNLLCRISTILVKSSSSKAALEMEPRVGIAGAHVFPLVASSVTLQMLKASSERYPYQKTKTKTSYHTRNRPRSSQNIDELTIVRGWHL